MWKYAKLEMFELCFDLKSVARSSGNQSETLGDCTERNFSVVGTRTMVLRGSLQLVSGMRPHNPWSEQRSNAFVLYVRKKGVVQER